MLTICFCGADQAWEELLKHGFRRRNTCLLRGFAQHPEVERLYVVCTVTRGTYFQKMRERQKRWVGAPGLQEGQKVIDVFVARLVPERWWLPGTGIVNRWLARRQARAQMPDLESSGAVVWCYWPKGFQVAKFLDLPGEWIFDADHNIIEDVNLEAVERKTIHKVLLECGRRARFLVAASRSMLGWFRRPGFGQCVYLRNGVDLARFEDKPQMPEELARIPRPRIGYVGTLSRWVDYELLAGLARRRPDWNFIVGGPVLRMEEMPGFKDLRNVTFTGQKSEKEIPGVLAAFDMGLGLYHKKYSTWVDVDSMKIFEYLAAGTPVVATPYHPHLKEDFGGLVELAEGVEGFEAAIERILAQGEESAERARARGQFLSENTWARRAEEAVQLIRNLADSGRCG